MDGEIPTREMMLATMAAKPKGGAAPPFDRLLTLRESGVSIDVEPPEPRWSYTRTDFDDGLEVGVVERGLVGMLVGYPGIGKSTIALGAAVSTACGCDWLGWHPNETGRVLFATAEESQLHVLRRLYRLTRALNLSRAQLDAVERNVVVWPLRGEAVAMVQGEAGAYAPTSFALTLREQLDRVEHALVLVDPLSRFGGPDTETSNAAGTAFVRELEALTEGRGNPTVLFSHHVGKVAKEVLGTMYAARGSSSLSGAVKWQANINAIEDERGGTWGVSIKSTKSNYAAPPPVLCMKWEAGTLRLASAAERRALDETKKAAKTRSEEHGR